EEEEVEIIQRTTSTTHAEPQAVIDADAVRNAQELVRACPVPDHVVRYALRLVRATRIREHSEDNPKPEVVREYLAWGAGPRASQYLTLAAKARAVLRGAFNATPEDVRAVARPVLRHRIIANFNAEADGVTTDTVIDRLLEETPVDGSSDTERRQMASVTR
ncbi:MAG: AAA family ATPase, partial [Planctomycetota bacterium]